MVLLNLGYQRLCATQVKIENKAKQSNIAISASQIRSCPVNVH